MNYGQLKTAVLEHAHAPELTAEVAGFVRLAEGLIRRELRAYELAYTLDESDRVALGVYTLPATLLEVRAIYATDAAGETFALENVGVVGIRNALATSPVLSYAVRGDNTIEFRGVPATDAELEVLYLGHPVAFSADGDENDLLTNHEAIYLYGALHYLYTWTEDLELAGAARENCLDAIEKLNQQIGRKIGGGSVVPGYNLGLYNAGSGY